MPKISRTRPDYLDKMRKHHVSGINQVWVSPDGDFYYTWDSNHGEIEAFSNRGRHVGVLDPISGVKIKDAVRGRRIDV